MSQREAFDEGSGLALPSASPPPRAWPASPRVQVTAPKVEPTFRCSECGAAYAEAAWSALALSQSLEPGEVGKNVLHWPAEFRIEVRVCATCGHRLAARRHI